MLHALHAAALLTLLRVRPSVRPSVPCSYRSVLLLAAGLLLWVWRAGDIDRLLHGLRRSSTAVSSKREQ